MHGAYATGLREAARVMTAFAHQRGEDMDLKQQQGVPEVDEATAAEGLELIRASHLLQQVQTSICSTFCRSRTALRFCCQLLQQSPRSCRR